MGKLYWKFFLFFFLAQLTSVLGVAVALWIYNQKLDFEYAKIEANPPARAIVEAAGSTLEFGGIQSLGALIQRWDSQRFPPLYAVNEQNVELFKRTLSPDVIKAARELLTKPQLHRAVKEVQANDGHRYLLFVPSPSDKAHLDNAMGSKANHLLSLRLDRDLMMGSHAPAKIRHLFPFMPILAGVLASLIFAALLARYFSKPIKRLRQAFDSVANGNLDTRVGDDMGKRNDELADLGNAFDVMAVRLGVLMKSQTRLLHQVSHEMRSPLARLQLAVGLAKQTRDMPTFEKDSSDKLDISLERIERESMRMDGLIGELLELSRFESGAINIQKEPIDMGELLTSVVEDAQYEADAKHIEVTLDGQDSAIVAGQPELLHRALENIIRNAIKYSPNNSAVLITLNCEKNKENSRENISSVSHSRWMQITVADEGTGVPEGELRSIFEPFVRGSNAANREGHGVGLAIAKQLLEVHGGNVSARNQASGGLFVEITLPVL